jgi:hypothetical protein
MYILVLDGDKFVVLDIVRNVLNSLLWAEFIDLKKLYF